VSQITLSNITKKYGDVTAVDDVTLEIRDREFVTLVGPSGCGKTTTLNLVAGLIEITDGDIYIGDRLVNDLDPKDRDIAMVFQNYALYPHKSVYENMAFPLRMRKYDKTEIERRVQQAAQILGIKELLNRRPRQLSGGQQQRVALGRALVRSPQVFLMDEPLSNLDAKLRVQMRAELKRLHQEVTTTVIYVTHDQMEAMTLSDRVAVMGSGKVQQFGTPQEVFDQPVNMFVAGFIGSPMMNFIPCRYRNDGGEPRLVADGFSLPVPNEKQRAIERSATGPELILGVRHRNIRLGRPSGNGAIKGQIYTVEPTGDVTFVHLKLGDQLLIASTEPTFTGRADDSILFDFDERYLHVFDARSQTALTVG
jgi:multiple sugar transport system ATP-binding protein